MSIRKRLASIVRRRPEATSVVLLHDAFPQRPQRTPLRERCPHCAMNGDFHASWCPRDERLLTPGEARTYGWGDSSGGAPFISDHRMVFRYNHTYVDSGDIYGCNAMFGARRCGGGKWQHREAP